MIDPAPNDPRRSGPGPFGPPPASPPIRANVAPYADPFAAAAPSPSSPAPHRSREGLWVALAALLGAALVIAAIAWFTTRSDDEGGLGDVGDSAAAPSTTEVPAIETPTTAPPAAGCPEGVREEICDAVAFVEAIRGRPFKEFPVVEFADDAAFRRRLGEGLDADWERETEVDGEVLGSLGLVPVGTDLVDVTARSLDVSVGGVYYPASSELLVRGTEIDLFVELVVVHELVHAHDDQWLDLDRPELDTADDDRHAAFLAVVEGNASRVERIWRQQLSEDERAELALLEASYYDADDIAVIQQIPSFVLQAQFFPYERGPSLVEAIVADAGGGDAGERAVDAAIVDPPTTTEQALHPEQFLDGTTTAAVPTPPAGGEGGADQVLDEGVIGELVFDLWFGDDVGDGWNGDRYVSFESDGRTCTVVYVAADTDRDLDEIFDAAAVWVGDAEIGDQRRSDQANVDGVDLVVIEGCR